LPNGSRQCGRKSGLPKDLPKGRVSGTRFAGFMRKAVRIPGTEARITNGNFDNKKHTAQRKDFRWRCLHTDICSRPEKNAENPIGANQTMRTSSKAILSEIEVNFPVQEPRNIYEKRRIFHENRTYQKAESH
jgi:hypothetical protein